MTTVYEGDSSNPRRMTGKAILAEMTSRTDPVHWEIMDRLRDACIHEYPWVITESGETTMCSGCSRTHEQIEARRIRAALMDKPVWTVSEFRAWQAAIRDV